MCYCVDSYDKTIESHECYKKCHGDMTEICGGSARSVYKNGISKKTKI